MSNMIRVKYTYVIALGHQAENIIATHTLLNYPITPPPPPPPVRKNKTFEKVYADGRKTWKNYPACKESQDREA